jgi:putative ABC transport system permease protein
MNFLKLAWRNTQGNTFRSITVLICAALMAGFAVAATVVIGGAQKSLNLALERLGADIIVISAGTEHLMENAFLMGVPARTWMPSEFIDEIGDLPGVDQVSPQFYLSTLRGAACCSVPEMLLIAYDPETDFTLKPWLEENLDDDGLGLGEAVGGNYIFVPHLRDRNYLARQPAANGHRPGSQHVYYTRDCPTDRKIIHRTCDGYLGNPPG